MFRSTSLRSTATDRWQCFDDRPITGVLAIPLNSSNYGKDMTVHCATCDLYGERRLHCQDDSLERGSDGAFSYKCLQGTCLKRKIAPIFKGGLRKKSCLWKPRGREHFMSSLDIVGCTEDDLDRLMALHGTSWTVQGIMFGAALLILAMVVAFIACGVCIAFNAIVW